MNIFVINSGSSSIKYQLIQMPQAKLLCSGLVDRIALSNASITHKAYKDGVEKVYTANMEIENHGIGLQAVANLLTNNEYGVITNPNQIAVVGHRVVHGGNFFSNTVTINQLVKEQIKKLFTLGPLHNPANYTGIDVAEKIFSSAVQVAVFDTAFHQSMPPKAYRYAIPNELYTQHHIRAYGFHGTSHKYVSEKALEYLENKNAKIITVHLGNGSSMAAVKAGECIDTTMGLGPLSGLLMGTRSGDIDATVIFYLTNQLGYTIQEVDTLLNKKSGLLGLTGFSDMRDVKKAIAAGDENAILAYDMYAYRIKKYIGAYAVAMEGLDAIVFTGGIGENDSDMRRACLQGLSFLGVMIDEETNQQKVNGIKQISNANSAVKVLVVPTNEELEIAKQCYQLLQPQLK